jgi:3-phosphoshikimate 1-carboxyvinyltransferase
VSGHGATDPYIVAGGSPYIARDLFIEGDASGAAYFLAAAALGRGRVRCVNLDGRGSLQGDVRFAGILERMGCQLRRGDGWLEAAGPAGLLEPVDADMNDMPDQVPTLAVLALFAGGTTRIRNVAHLAIKESDRLGALAGELKRLGGRVRQREDGLIIQGDGGQRLCGAEVETYRDHRMAMSLALAGLRVSGVAIRDPGCTAKSFPGFFPALFSLACGLSLK